MPGCWTLPISSPQGWPVMGILNQWAAMPSTCPCRARTFGLTIETVSRTLRSLESCAAIEVPSLRHIVLRNRPVLIRMNG